MTSNVTSITEVRNASASSSVVSCAFFLLCMYSKFRHLPHPLGYLFAKFRFFCGLHCWASPLSKIAYSITDSPSLFDTAGTEACTSQQENMLQVIVSWHITTHLIQSVKSILQLATPLHCHQPHLTPLREQVADTWILKYGLRRLPAMQTPSTSHTHTQCHHHITSSSTERTSDNQRLGTSNFTTSVAMHPT